MTVYEVIKEIACADSNDNIIVTDRQNEFELDCIRTDNGFVEFYITNKGADKNDYNRILRNKKEAYYLDFF